MFSASFYFRLFSVVSIAALIIAIISCATPTQPTGGPADNTPPVITDTEPQNGTVLFDGDEIRFFFDKYVNRESFASNFRIDPIEGVRYDLRWSGRSVRVRFEEPLPDSTTVIFTVGTGFSDTNRNRIREPFVLALSTGDTIDEGEIEGRVIDAQSGRGKEEAFVFLYRQPFDLEGRAAYVAETDSAGRFTFTYLSSGTYKAFWVDDRNRNRRWERASESARPFYRESVHVNQQRTSQLGRTYISEPDTIRPRLQGTGMLSSQRLRLRYSKGMEIDSEATIDIVNPEGEFFANAVPLFVDKEQANVVFAHAERELPEDLDFKVRTIGITDRHGNEPRSEAPVFSGSAEPDTTHIRLIRHITERGVLQDEPMIFEFSALIEGTSVVDSLEVVRDETIFEAWDPLEIQNNLLILYPPERWSESSDYTIRIFDERTGSRKNISTKIFPYSRMGTLRIQINEDQRIEGIFHHISIRNEVDDVVFEGRTEGELLVENLVPGNYKVFSFRDDDGDEQWFRGEVDPFAAPEPFHVERGVEVHSRMEGDLEITYQAAPAERGGPIEFADPDETDEPDEPEESEQPEPEEPDETEEGDP